MLLVQSYQWFAQFLPPTIMFKVPTPAPSHNHLLFFKLYCKLYFAILYVEIKPEGAVKLLVVFFSSIGVGEHHFPEMKMKRKKTYKETLSLLSKECREKKKGPIRLIQSQRPSLRISARCICKSLLFSNDQQRNLSGGRCSLRSRSPSSWSQRRSACMEPSPHPPASLACSLK